MYYYVLHLLVCCLSFVHRNNISVNLDKLKMLLIQVFFHSFIPIMANAISCTTLKNRGLLEV